MKTAIVVWTVLFVASANSFAQTAAVGREEAAREPPLTKASEAPHERKLFSLNHVYAPNLAQTILKAFNDGKRPTLTVVPEQASNSLFVSAPAETLKEVGEFIAKMDRKPAVIAIDVWIIDLRGDEKVAAKPAEPLQGGERKAVLEKLSQLEKAGRATVINHLQLKTMDNQSAYMHQGERRPRTVTTTSAAATSSAAARTATASPATTGTGTRPARTSTSTLDNLGTIVRVQPRVNAENQIFMLLDVQKSNSATGPESAIVTQPEDGPAIYEVQTPIQIALVVQTTVVVMNGEVLNLSSINNAPSEAANSYQVLVSAEVAPEGAK